MLCQNIAGGNDVGEANSTSTSSPRGNMCALIRRHCALPDDQQSSSRRELPDDQQSSSLSSLMTSSRSSSSRPGFYRAVREGGRVTRRGGGAKQGARARQGSTKRAHVRWAVGEVHAQWRAAAVCVKSVQRAAGSARGRAPLHPRPSLCAGLCCTYLSTWCKCPHTACLSPHVCWPNGGVVTIYRMERVVRRRCVILLRPCTADGALVVVDNG